MWPENPDKSAEVHPPLLLTVVVVVTSSVTTFRVSTTEM